MKNPFRRNHSTRVPAEQRAQTFAIETQYAVILDVVKAHHDNGTQRATVQRALLQLAADDLAPMIVRAVHETWGCSCPESISGRQPFHYSETAEPPRRRLMGPVA